MPTYEYACESCGNRYEKREGFDAPARQKCPRCKKMANRLLFAPPVVFKGSGFYKTDSRGGSSNGSSAGSSAESSRSDDSTSESTPAVAPAAEGHSHGPGSHTHDTPATTETPAAG